MSYYIGTGPADVINSFIKRYFYGMRRNTDGELFLLKSDQQKGGSDAITINEVGEASGNFPDFEEGISYLDGINETHDIVYDNLRYQQLNSDHYSDHINRLGRQIYKLITSLIPTLSHFLYFRFY